MQHDQIIVKKIYVRYVTVSCFFISQFPHVSFIILDDLVKILRRWSCGHASKNGQHRPCLKSACRCSGIDGFTRAISMDCWLVVWNMVFMTFHILGIMIPADELIFFRGVGIPPTRLA